MADEVTGTKRPRPPATETCTVCGEPLPKQQESPFVCSIRCLEKLAR